jgi:hypothetical protein
MTFAFHTLNGIFTRLEFITFLCRFASYFFKQVREAINLGALFAYLLFESFQLLRIAANLCSKSKGL